MTDVWILGGTGRVGRSVAADLAASGIHPVLVGRDAGRLREAAGDRGFGTYTAPTLDDVTAGVRQARPAVVVNTVGPFTTTGPAVVDVCLEVGADYVDLANDLAAVTALLSRQADAERAGRTLVTGAGFGVTATESVVAWLCVGDTHHGDSDAGGDSNAGGRRAARVRTDMLPSLAVTAGALGEALAGTLVEGLPGVPGGGRFQGRRFDHGRLAPAPLAGEVHALVTPDGDHLAAALMPLGELVAAQRASGAPYVESASSEVPTSRVPGAVLPLAARLLSIAPLRRFAARRLAAVRFTDRPAPRAHSWGHAVVTWEDGTTSEGWLRLGEAQATTDAVAAEVTRRLVRGEGRPGAFTPAALFGHALANSL
ncbi:MAG: saccharopine dehydrogenase NADP-binding domain-containing protein, partial [Janthinobacterium lividum]